MLTLVKSSGRTFIVEKITHAILLADQIRIFPVDYHEVILSGEDMKAMIAAMEKSGFIRSADTLVNLTRISVMEDQTSDLVRIYLEGADRILYLPKSTTNIQFPAPESKPDKVEKVEKKPATKRSGQ